MKTIFRKPKQSLIERQGEWRQWQDSNMAANLAALEKQVVDPLMSKTFGNHLLQLSIAGSQPLWEASRVANQTIVHFDFPVEGLGHALVSEPDYLAVSNESMDVVILHHVLEFSPSPHQILREAQRVLASGGFLFVLGFNPWSLWSLKRCFSLSNAAPWRGSYLSRTRVSDWLNLLDFQLQDTQFGYFKFPVNNPKLIASCNQLERYGQKYNCFLGGFYVMVARKQVVGLTPLRTEKLARRIIPFPITEPTTRSLKTSD